MTRSTRQRELFATDASDLVVDASEDDADPRPEGWPGHLPGPQELARRQTVYLDTVRREQARRGDARRAAEGAPDAETSPPTAR